MSEQFYDLVPASIRHIKPLSQTLRPAACATLRAFGADPRRALHQALRQSGYARTVILNGLPVAMWGTAGAMLSDNLTIWAAIGTEAVRFPLAVVRRARAELKILGEHGTELRAMVAREDERAILFARTIGFAETDDFDVPDGMLAVRFGEAQWR